MTTLDVLVVENNPGAATHQVGTLEAAGHRVHRCHDPGQDGFPCRAITHERTCPLDEGIDVGLVVRRGVTPRPTDRETGVSCIIRAGVPLLEDGPAVLDPYEPYLVGRVGDDVVADCEAAADKGHDPLRAAITTKIARILGGAGIPADAIDIRFQRTRTDLRVELTGPDLPQATQQALGVRVLDAVRSVGREAGRTYGEVDVSYRIAEA